MMEDKSMCTECGFTYCPDGCPSHALHTYSCPVCDRECEIIYTNKNTGTALGCEKCIREIESIQYFDFDASQMNGGI